MYVVWRVKSELRGLKWNQLSFADRRAIVEKILGEAIELADWMYSHRQPDDLKQKKKLAGQKRKVALQYARDQMVALGAASQDRDTLKLRLEHVLAEQNPGKIRFGAQQVARIKVE